MTWRIWIILGTLVLAYIAVGMSHDPDDPGSGDDGQIM